MPTLSVILITRNEEANLADCLNSLGDLATQIVVVDTDSTDETLKIAAEFGATISQPADWPGFGPQKNRALDLATSEWVLSLDADERLTPELRAEIQLAIAHPHQQTCFAIPRSSWYCGRFMRHSGWTPDYVNRLFLRGTARFSDDLVHEQLISNANHGKPIGKLQQPMLHYSFMNAAQVQQKMQRYSTAAAEQAFARGKKSSPQKAILHGVWTFIRTYILQAGFLDGSQGFSLAISNMQGTYHRYMKLWRLNQQQIANKGRPPV
jgi:glycosyltransferase involved in cell wall biosynthesis